MTVSTFGGTTAWYCTAVGPWWGPGCHGYCDCDKVEATTAWCCTAIGGASGYHGHCDRDVSDVGVSDGDATGDNDALCDNNNYDEGPTVCHS